METKQCPYCDAELERKWDTYWSKSKQRLTKQLLYYCPKHDKLFQNFNDGLQELYPNHKIYAKVGL